MNDSYYKEKIQQLLQDDITYKLISENRDLTIINKIKKFSKKYENVLTEKEAPIHN